MLLALATLASFAPQGPGPSLAPVVINEFSNDDAGTDNVEFVELWNRTAAPVDISGWTLNGEEGTNGQPANGTFTFPGAPGSNTTLINPGQYVVVGQVAVPNVSFIITGASPGLVLENTDSDGITLRDGAGNVIDSVVWAYARWTAPVPTWLEGTGLYGAYVWSDSSGQLPQGQLTAQRWVDGFDSNSNGADFLMLQFSPGAANGTTNTLPLAMVENFDGAAGTIANDISYSFVGPSIQDPAAVLVATGTTRVYPPSPQGGNLCRVQDPTGGGNVILPNLLVGSDFLVETYVYITGGNAGIGAGQGESWAIGVRGSTSAFGAPFDVAGTYYAQANLCTGNGNQAPGATGLAWMGYVSATQTDIYLVDANDGGPNPTVLAGPITATTGVNDGWQRLRLRVSGGNFIANFGGNYAVDNGQRFTGTVAPNVGTVYVQYRECVLTNSQIAGLYLDQLEVYGAVDTSVTFAGTPSPTSFGTPNIGIAGGNPDIGNANFALTSGGMIPGGVSIVALDLGVLLPGIPVPGAQPALLVYAAPTFTATVLNDLTGNASFAFPIPANNSLLGTVLAAQYFDVDPTLPFALPFGSSRGAQLAIGNG
jgi:Lamin Tail Domain